MDNFNFQEGEKPRSGIVQNRRDYWIVSSALEYLIESVDIKPGYCSDHSILNLNIELIGTQTRGRGSWKFNNNLLQDDNYFILVKITLTVYQKTSYLKIKSLWWEYIKCQLPTETIFMQQQKQKKNSKKIRERIIRFVKRVRKSIK